MSNPKVNNFPFSIRKKKISQKNLTFTFECVMPIEFIQDDAFSSADFSATFARTIKEHYTICKLVKENVLFTEDKGNNGIY